jgi:pimeloyl-ACP methyl ester carboxylesterase
MQPIRVEYDNNPTALSSGLVISYCYEGLNSSTKLGLVMVHGRNAHSGTWRNNIPYFVQNGWRVVAPTLPRTSGEPRAENISEYANIIHELVSEKLGIEEINAIGNSMGGWIATQLAVSYPNLVKRLVL